MTSGKLLLAVLGISAWVCICQASYPGYAHSQLLEIILPENPVEDFSYMPTLEGYKFSYRLADGTRHDETANIVDPRDPNVAAYLMSVSARRDRPRPRGGNVNRKLSPKSLQSLAG